MFKKTFATAILAGATLFAAQFSGAQAQAASRGPTAEVPAAVQIDYRRGGRGWDDDRRHGRHGRLQPHEIRRSLVHQGYRHVADMQPRGSVYVVRAVGWRGMPQQLIVDAYTARILERRPAGYGPHGGHRW
ncbi:hypothetical protein [Polymorphum gilvum]|uniref:PepSY domain-containing protein n=1 Tax=Polymorphum gilvum (strain LMG 25793 / CGMCC 1.9160 / SL003B-26A1) TaxID=991905 RepID=F2IWI6_POLGS|nr:hypothetical protein [Polymorphum gilvum]ADZ69285.1 hypothetical protein SL003B_0855 [Polymorphum gilvum SL003B-26A1]